MGYYEFVPDSRQVARGTDPASMVNNKTTELGFLGPSPEGEQRNILNHPATEHFNREASDSLICGISASAYPTYSPAVYGVAGLNDWRSRGTWAPSAERSRIVLTTSHSPSCKALPGSMLQRVAERRE